MAALLGDTHIWLARSLSMIESPPIFHQDNCHFPISESGIVPSLGSPSHSIVEHHDHISYFLTHDSGHQKIRHFETNPTLAPGAFRDGRRCRSRPGIRRTWWSWWPAKPWSACVVPQRSLARGRPEPTSCWWVVMVTWWGMGREKTISL